jgi:hypothetical protein
MGRTVPTFTQLLHAEMSALARYRRALRQEDQRVLDGLFAHARQHAAESAYASHLSPFETMLLSALLELAKRVRHLEARGS